MLGRHDHKCQEKIKSQTGKNIIVGFRFCYYNGHDYITNYLLLSTLKN